MEPTQILLVIVVTVLTIVLTVIGIQVAMILSEVKKSAEKVNKMLDDATTVAGTVSRSVTGMSGLIDGLKTGLSVVSWFGKKKEEQ